KAHPALADLPALKPGGEALPHLYDTSKLSKLELEAETLRRQIEEREQKKREGLRVWGKLQREVEVAGLRSELAEGSLRELGGE
ncbi:hypothetical protein EJ03DRAFT_242946, partial [Teratosphaeria nubilosa]